MHAAPPVAVRCTAAWTWRALQSGLAALAAGVFVYWGLATGWQTASSALQLALALAAALAVGAVAWRRSATPAQWLDWDGQRWALDGQPGELRLMLDAGYALLLRHAGRRWVLASRSDAAAAWHGLRVAVYARGSTPADDRGSTRA